jgi:hypothetical protein
MIRRAGKDTLVTGIEIFPFDSRIWPSGPAGVVVVVVLGVDVDVEPVVLVVELVELVELEVDLVVESVLLVVVSARTPSGPAKPALAK